MRFSLHNRYVGLFVSTIGTRPATTLSATIRTQNKQKFHDG